MDPLKAVSLFFFLTLFHIVLIASEFALPFACAEEGRGWLLLFSMNNIMWGCENNFIFSSVVVLRVPAQPRFDHRDPVVLFREEGGRDIGIFFGLRKTTTTTRSTSVEIIPPVTSCGYFGANWKGKQSVQASLSMGNIWQWNPPSCITLTTPTSPYMSPLSLPHLFSLWLDFVNVLGEPGEKKRGKKKKTHTHKALAMPVTSFHLHIPERPNWYSKAEPKPHLRLTLVISEPHRAVCVTIFLI